MGDQTIAVLGDALVDVLRDEGGEQRFVGGAGYDVAVTTGDDR